MSKLNCYNCKNQYNEKNHLPFILPCNHVVCSSCLKNHKNKNLYFCQRCNKNLILSNTNLKLDKKILKKLHIKLKNRSTNKSYFSTKYGNEEEEEEEDKEDGEENEEGEEEEDEENEEEEDEDTYENDKIVEENTENENDISENNENNNITKIKNEQKPNKNENPTVRRSILKKNPRFSGQPNIVEKDDYNTKDNKNDISKMKKSKISSKNKFDRRKSKFTRKTSRDIGASRVNFTSDVSSPNRSIKESENSEESENEEEQEESDENTSNNKKNKDSSNDKSKKLSSRKGSNVAISNRNSLNKKKEYKAKKLEESESGPIVEGNDFCIYHKEKPIEFFCSDCSSAICSLCLYESHNGHKLSLLDEMSGIIKKNMGELFTRLQDIVKINKDNKFNWQKRKDEVNDFQKQQINIVIKSFKEIINKIEEKKALIIKEFKNKYNHEFNRLEQIKLAIDNNGKEMEKINNLIENHIKSFNTSTDAMILKDVEKYKKIFKQIGLDFIKLQKNEIAMKTEINIDPAMRPMTVNIKGLIELLNKVEPRNICYPKVISISKDENDNINLSQQKNYGKNDLKFSHSSFTTLNNNMNNNYKSIEEKKYQNDNDNYYNNINQNQFLNVRNRNSFQNNNKYYIENNPQQNYKYRNNIGNINFNSMNNNKFNPNDLNDSNYGEYGPPNHNRGKYIRQLEMTPTATFSNVRRSSKYGTFKDSPNNYANIPNNYINDNNNHVNGKNYNGNYNQNTPAAEGQGIFKENGFGSRGSEYSNHNNYNNNYKRTRNNSFGSFNENNNSILQRKNMMVLKERNPSACLPLKMNEAIILPKISPLPKNSQNSSNKSLNKNNIRYNNNSDSEKSNKDIEDSVYFFGEADYCLKFYFKNRNWELISYKTQLSRQIGFLRYSGVCSLPSYRIILSGGCKKETDEPSNLFFLINSKNINDIKNLRNMPKKKYYHGCIFLNNNIYIIGGYEHYDRASSIPSTLKTVERYDMSKKQWQNLHGLNEARACFGQCVFNGQIFVFGGLYNGSTLESIEKYDEESNAWSFYHIKLPMKLAKPGIVNIDNKNIYVIGGNDENYIPVNNVYKCQLDSDKDKNVWSSQQDLICPRTTGNACFLWKNNIFVFGGSSTNYFERFIIDENRWENIENFSSIINSSNVETILTNYCCVLNHYSAFL